MLTLPRQAYAFNVSRAALLPTASPAVKAAWCDLVVDGMETGSLARYTNCCWWVAKYLPLASLIFLDRVPACLPLAALTGLQIAPVARRWKYSRTITDCNQLRRGREGGDKAVNAAAQLRWSRKRRKPVVVLVATRDIEEGEEIVLDYGQVRGLLI